MKCEYCPLSCVELSGSSPQISPEWSYHEAERGTHTSTLSNFQFSVLLSRSLLYLFLSLFPSASHKHTRTQFLLSVELYVLSPLGAWAAYPDDQAAILEAAFSRRQTNATVPFCLFFLPFSFIEFAFSYVLSDLLSSMRPYVHLTDHR